MGYWGVLYGGYSDYDRMCTSGTRLVNGTLDDYIRTRNDLYAKALDSIFGFVRNRSYLDCVMPLL